MTVWDFLNAINWDKKNLFTETDSPEAVNKMYNMFIVNRALSYSADTVFYAAELNSKGLKEFGLSNRMHFEFLLHTIPKKKRFNKWGKIEKDDLTELIMEEYNYSYEKARDIIPFLDEEDKKRLISKNYGGVMKK